jgi:hypothetical protein
MVHVIDDDVTFEPCSFFDETAQNLVRGYLDELALRMPTFDPAAADPPGPTDFEPPDGAFLVVSISGEPVGCGAIRRIADGVGELRRMWGLT